MVVFLLLQILVSGTCQGHCAQQHQLTLYSEKESHSHGLIDIAEATLQKQFRCQLLKPHTHQEDMKKFIKYEAFEREQGAPKLT